MASKDGAEEVQAPRFSRLDKTHIVELFKQLDQNEDGKIDVQEIRNRLTEQGIDPNVAEVITKRQNYQKYLALNFSFIDNFFSLLLKLATKTKMEGWT